MSAYAKLAVAAMLPVVFSAAFYLLDKKTGFGRLNEKIKQAVYGLFFGLLAVLGNEWGIHVNGATLNSRDAAVLAAGLFFGGPAGMIAGVIGGIERVIAVSWGAGAFTAIACSISTVFAGVYAALLRRIMFEGKQPGWLISCAVGVVMEVVHLTMIFITNMDMPNEAMEVIRLCASPMIAANGLSVMLSSVVLSIFHGNKDRAAAGRGGIRISQTIQRWLLVAILLAFAATSFFVFRLQNGLADAQADSLLSLALDETEADIRDLTDTGLSRQDIDNEIIVLTRNRHVGETGYILIIDGDFNIVSEPEGLGLTNIRGDIGTDDFPGEDVTFTASPGGTDCLLRYRSAEGYHVVSVLPEAEAFHMRNIALYVNSFLEIIVFAVLFGLIYILIKRVVVDQIKSVNSSLARITDGDLNEIVDVRSNEEFSLLSDDINMTVDTLKHYIDEASKRIDRELELAKNIQSSALPGVFPAFPKRTDLDIFAVMDPAKEVGGDFYDFYLTQNNRLNFLVADVSGKGIPAAMFMMRAKSELKSLTEADMPLSDVFSHCNDSLCGGNDAGMFVTAWQGMIELDTGLLRYSNAGHNPPLLRRGNGGFEYLRERSGLVLAGMEGIRYKTQELKLLPGDIIFLYTDGVTEAMNAGKELYGEERLFDTLNKAEFSDMKELCGLVRADIDAFSGDGEQFDDITMLALRYIGTEPAASIGFDEAVLGDIEAVTEFAEREMERMGCPAETATSVCVAIDEIFSNIVRYGYPKAAGPVRVRIYEQTEPRAVCIRFEDEGIPYNPLKKEDPDITLPAEEREIGGLGIFMVKKLMDEMKYEYENERNILILKKKY